MRVKGWTICFVLALSGLTETLRGQGLSEDGVIPEAPVFQERGGEGWILMPTRWDHNIGITFGMSRGTWELEGLDPVRGQQFPSQAFLGKVQYTFHLPIVGNLGYVLGSSLGYYLEEGRYHDELHRVSSIHFPGIHLGLVLNVTPGLRVEGAFETYLERIDELALDTKEGRKKISMTMRPDYDLMLSMDMFYSLHWGVRVEWHKRRVSNTPPRESEGQIVDSLIRKKDNWIAVGFIFHFFAG